MNSDDEDFRSLRTRREFLFGTVGAAALFLGTSELKAAGVRPPHPDELVRPSETDPKIRTFDYPHGIYYPSPDVPSRGLFLFIPGTATEPLRHPGVPWLCRWAALLGYHVIFLMYPNSVAAAEVCRDSSDPDAFAVFRWALIEGGRTPYISIPRVESIEYRMIKLIEFLDRRRPNRGWAEFVDNGHIAWGRIAVAGQSQGGGHAAIIATKYLVARVLCFGAPKDYSRRLNAPAKWYGSTITPPRRFFAFNHVQDHQGCSPREQVDNLKALGIIGVGGMADVDREARPFHHAHALFTNYPGTKLDSKVAHVSVSQGDIRMPTGRPHFAPVWGYMLTAPTA